MSNRWYWAGHVQNCSEEWLWCLFDEDDQVVAKILRPGRSSPQWTDVDAVKAYRTGTTLSGYGSWWQLVGGAEASVGRPARACSEGISIVKTSDCGSLKQTTEKDWGDIAYDFNDQEWGS